MTYKFFVCPQKRLHRKTSKKNDWLNITNERTRYIIVHSEHPIRVASNESDHNEHGA